MTTFIGTLAKLFQQHLPPLKQVRCFCANPASTMPSPTEGSLHQPQRSKVAVGQMTSTSDREANYIICQQLAQAAVAEGCSMLFLPECFSFIGGSPAESTAAASPLEGPIMQRYLKLAQSNRLWLSLGGFQEHCSTDPQRLQNCHVIVDDTGQIVSTYRKVHLFDVEVFNGPVLKETTCTVPGKQLVTCDSPAGKLGLTVCYDLRFPEIYQLLAWHMGAQIMLVPSAFTVATGKAHWELLLRARAVECQCYVIAAAQAGRHNEKRESYGHSIIVDPWGQVVGKLKDPLATGIATAEINLEHLQQIRAKMPIVKHRQLGRECLALPPAL
ncbi:hypothetical protein ABBQ32_002588 [Trebouxia sp. C0010 RCD-2024]